MSNLRISSMNITVSLDWMTLEGKSQWTMSFLKIWTVVDPLSETKDLMNLPIQGQILVLILLSTNIEQTVTIVL